ncbi:MAG TPA: hypothetical protein VF746_07525 [Longimicrobium sp.]|jgi:hypothetical protein
MRPAAPLALALALAAAACARAPREGLEGPAPREGALACAPAVLRAGDTLTVRLGRPHPGELAVVAPDGTYFVLASAAVEREYADSAGARLIPAEAFARMDRLALGTRDAAALPYVRGRARNERIFQAAGTYELRLSDNLFTDAGGEVRRCRVRYLAP